MAGFFASAIQAAMRLARLSAANLLFCVAEMYSARIVYLIGSKPGGNRGR